MLNISGRISIPENEVRLEAVRSSGPGGQNVNKVSTAVHLRFDIQQSSLPDDLKERLLALRDRRVSKDGILVIKAQRFRSQEKNREDARLRLKAFISKALVRQKNRKPTRPSGNARKKRVDQKTRRGRIKALRGKVSSRED